MIPDATSQAIRESPSSPLWLISIQETREMDLALDFPVDILDLKAPSRGPLAPVSIDTMRSAVDRLERQKSDGQEMPQLSVALGELDDATEIASKIPSGIGFAKAGPHNQRSPRELRLCWQRLRDQIPEETELVAVAYADHIAADCLPPDEIAAAAAECGFRRLLIDTYDKSGGATTNVITEASLSDFARQVRRQGMWWALAGSITLEIVERLDATGELAKIAPDCLAMRGDVCRRGRVSELCPMRLGRWKEWFRRRRPEMEAEARPAVRT